MRLQAISSACKPCACISGHDVGSRYFEDLVEAQLSYSPKRGRFVVYAAVVQPPDRLLPSVNRADPGSQIPTEWCAAGQLCVLPQTWRVVHSGLHEDCSHSSSSHLCTPYVGPSGGHQGLRQLVLVVAGTTVRPHSSSLLCLLKHHFASCSATKAALLHIHSMKSRGRNIRNFTFMSEYACMQGCISRKTSLLWASGGPSSLCALPLDMRGTCLGGFITWLA